MYVLLRMLLMVAVMGMFTTTSMTAQQRRTIIAKVKPRKIVKQCNNQPLIWRVTVNIMQNNQLLEPPRYSGEDWSDRMPLGANVEVGFGVSCYHPRSIPSFTVSGQEPQDKGVVQLNPIKGCPICPSGSRSASASVSGTSASGTNTGVTGQARSSAATTGGKASVANDTTPDPATVPSFEAFDYESREHLAKPSPQQLLAELEQDAEISKKFGFTDVFRFNFEVMSEIFSEDSELRQVLEKFKADPAQAMIFSVEGNLQSTMFRSIIRKQITGQGELDVQQLNRLISDPAIDASIRGGAVVALLDSDLNDQQKESLRTTLRGVTNTKDPFYLTSRIALGRIGNSQDRAGIVADIDSSDKDRAVAAMTAIRVANITEEWKSFKPAVTSIANQATNNEDADVRQAAVQALRPFALKHDPTAIQTMLTLLRGLGRDTDVEVRAEAAEALGLGNLEWRPDVRQVLRFAAKTDDSMDVRQVASVSLSGRVQFNHMQRLRK